LFDQHFANLATDSGAKINLSSSFKGIRNNSIIIKQANKTKQVSTDIIVGADGVKSAVAKAASLDKNRKYRIGMQARVKLSCEKNVYQVHFGSMFPNFFGWVVPESEDIARIGLASDTNPELSFKRFLATVAGPSWNKRIIESQGGLIPVYNPQAQTQQGKVFLVGDAACQIKNTTAGGIVPGLLAAEALSSSIIGSKDYQSAWKEKIGRSLWLHYKLRKVLDNFSDNDYNRLIELCKKNKVQHVIENESREFPAKLLLKLMIKEPKLLSFGRYLI
jgi:digeranylgeranylglycerophospholipid reductase